MNVVLAIAFAVAFLLGAYRDRTVVMIGPAVGLLEHPTIWLFLVAQIIIPTVVTRSVHSFRDIRRTGLSFTKTFLDAHSREIGEQLTSMLRRRDAQSKAVFDVLLFIGFCVWVWNSYQNQAPLRFVDFDFWDSILHPFGYWLTRFYKLYIFVLLTPALVHAQVCLVRSVRLLLSTATTERGIRLDPFHPDGSGGLTPLLNAVINPMVPIVLAASLLTVAAFWVHGKYDVTTIGGLTLTVALLLLVYLVPALALRRAILTEKRRQLAHVNRLQRTLYEDFFTTPAHVKEQADTLHSLGNVAKRIDDLPTWPQFARIARLIAAAASAPFVGWIAKRAEEIIPHLFRS